MRAVHATLKKLQQNDTLTDEQKWEKVVEIEQLVGAGNALSTLEAHHKENLKRSYESFTDYDVKRHLRYFELRFRIPDALLPPKPAPRLLAQFVSEPAGCQDIG